MKIELPAVSGHHDLQSHGPSRSGAALAWSAGTTVSRSASGGQEIAPFETVVNAAVADRGATASAPSLMPAHAKQADKTQKAFETVALQVFVESRLPDETSKMFGTGSAGKMWKSLLAEKIASQISNDGRISLLPESAFSSKLSSVPLERSAAASGMIATSSSAGIAQPWKADVTPAPQSAGSGPGNGSNEEVR